MSVRIALCLIGSLLLSACGGGGGGGGGGGQSGGGFTIQLQQSSVSLQYRDGQNVASASLDATWRGTPPNPLYVFAIVEGPGIAAPSISITETNAHATITALRMPVGEYSGRIVIRACPDSTCSSTVGGTPINVPYTVRVTPPLFTVGGDVVSQASIEHLLGLPAPTRTLDIAASVGAWTATATQPWIELSQTGGAGAAALVVTLRPELLSTQRMEGSVTISASTLGSQTFNISALIRTPAVQTSPGYVPVSGVAGAPLSLSQPVTVELGNGGTLPIASVIANQPWLRVSSISGQSFQVSLDSSVTALPSGSHTGIVTVTLEGGVVDLQQQLQVQLTLAQAAFTTPATIVLGGDAGHDFSDVSLPISLNTGSNAYTWAVSSPPSWLNIDRTSGSIAASGDTLTLRPIREQTTPGVATTSLHFSTTINGEVITHTVPVEFALDKRRLIASEVGIAFTELPGANYDQLTRTLKVRDNYNENIAWTAAVDAGAAWLTVTPSGSSGDDLEVTADTSGLTPDQLYTARIRIASNDSGIGNDEYVHVGLWVGASMPVTNRNLGGNSPQILGDPIRPYVYTHAFNEATIEVFNAYTGAQITTINGIPTNVVDMAASKDGQTLYVLASNNVVPVNLTTYAVGAPMTLPFASGNRQVLTYARPDGVGVLLDDEGTVNLAATGESVGYGPSGEFGLSGDDRLLFWADTRRSVGFSEARGKQFTMTRTGEFDGGDGLFGSYTAVNFDGSRVYMTRTSNVGGGPRVIVFNGQTLGSIVELEATLNFPKLLVTSRGQAVLSKLHYGSDDDVTVYNPDNSVALSDASLGDGSRDESVTGDGNFVLVTTHNSAWIVPIPR